MAHCQWASPIFQRRKRRSSPLVSKSQGIRKKLLLKLTQKIFNSTKIKKIAMHLKEE